MRITIRINLDKYPKNIVTQIAERIMMFCYGMSEVFLVTYEIEE